MALTRPLEPESSYGKVRAAIRKAGSLRARKRKSRWLLSVAAGILLLVGIGAAFFKPVAPARLLRQYTYVAGNQRSEVVLADGSRVTLNRNSRLTYADTYGVTDRTVELEGEAYFEVTKDASRKFEVRLGEASVCVLGTVFTVCADKEKGTVTATLVEGSVRFRCPGQQVTLTPSQQLVFVRASRRLDIRTVDVEKETAWKDGLLKYTSVPFARLIAELQQAYGVEVRIEDKRLAETSVTVSGTFSENQSFEEILDVIARSLPVRWTKRNGVYRLR
ncbi:MAG: FecR domain-containing protein [Parabacteroides sp.]|nr:FecR domain-containing protein [Parabacteroides sp.]